MAASIDNSVKEASKDNTSTLTTPAFTIGGVNRVLYVLAYAGAASPTVATSVKCGGSGGTALTKIGTEQTIGGFGVISLWRLIAPPTGSQTIYVDWGVNQDERLIIGVSVQDADQTTPNGTVASGLDSTVGPSITVTTVSGDLTLGFLGIMDDATDAKTITATQTTLQEIEGTEGGKLDGYEIAGAEYTTAVASTQAMAWAITGVALGDTNWAGMYGLAVKAVSAPAATAPPLPRPNPMRYLIFY